MSEEKRGAAWAVCLFLFLVLTVGVSVSWGSSELSVLSVWKILSSRLPIVSEWVVPDWPKSAETIVWHIRMPRIVLAALIGAALAVAGVIFQGVLQNPLAEPYILGVSSGAALGAAAVFYFGIEYALVGRWTLPLVAFMGGCVSLLLVFSLAKRDGPRSLEALILSGVIVQAFFGSLLSLLIALADERLQQIVYWLMGSVALLDWQGAWTMVPYLAAGLAVSLFYSRELNILALGEQTAYHIGVGIVKTRTVLLVTASLLTGAAVSLAGMIGFVGLVVPHIMRLVVGTDHHVLLPLSAVAGASYMIWADTFARMLLAPRELPVGVLTACIGIPLFAYLLRRHGQGT